MTQGLHEGVQFMNHCMDASISSCAHLILNQGHLGVSNLTSTSVVWLKTAQDDSVSTELESTSYRHSRALAHLFCNSVMIMNS